MIVGYLNSQWFTDEKFLGLEILVCIGELGVFTQIAGLIFQYGEEHCIRVSSFLSTQNQAPQFIIGMGRVIYHIKAFSVVVRTALKMAQFREKLV